MDLNIILYVIVILLEYLETMACINLGAFIQNTIQKWNYNNPQHKYHIKRDAGGEKCLSQNST